MLPAIASQPDFARMPTLGDVARYHAVAQPDQIALAFEGRETSFAAFDRRSDAIAAALASEGLGRGDRVAYLGKNSDRYFELLFGAAKLGVVVTPIGWRLASPEAAYIIADSAARLVFVGPEGAPQADAALATLPTPPRRIDTEGEAFTRWYDAAPEHAADAGVDPDAVAVQLYTSGTTGRPKGVMLTHRNILGVRQAAAEARMPWNMWASDDVSLVAMPVSHIGGTAWGISGLLNGAKGIIAREFDPLTVLDFIERDHVSNIFMVPAALQIVVRLPHARQVDYSRLRYILYGASPIPVDLLRECIAVFQCGFCQQYGMTETAGTIAFLPPEDHTLEGGPRMRSAGVPMPGVEIKVVDGAGATLPPHRVGEVAIRSIANMAGYWRMPEATAATIDAEGWLRTGDAGYLDEDGYLFIHDRVKDMIISGGENIYPAEVENAIYGHPAIAEVAVIGVPDPTWGEAVRAIVVFKPGEEAAAADIIAFARTRIAGFKLPKQVDVIEALPRNASGKILRRELREAHWAGRDRRIN